MSNLPFYIVIFALLAIIPVLICYTVLNGRILGLIRSIESLESIRKDYDLMDSRTIEQREKIGKMIVDIQGLEESFRQLNGKVVQRERAYEKAQKKREKEEPEQDEPDQIPVEQQAIPFPGFPLTPGNGLPIQQPAVPRRKFGELPNN